MALCFSACSGSDGAKEDPSLAAGRVCASTLDASAATALQRMGDARRFTELVDVNGSRESNKFTLQRAASTVHDDMTHRSQCIVFKAEDDTGHPLVRIDFSAVKYHPHADASGKDKSPGLVNYPIGVYANTHGNNSASLYFNCPTRDGEKASSSTAYIWASLYAATDQISAKSTSRDAMTVLNAISRGMAEQLGCAAQAELPAEIPEAEGG